MGAFVIFFFILLTYTIIICRRNSKLMASVARQCQSLRGRSATLGGYGVKAKDMQYFEMRNQNLMVGSTAPRITTPIPPEDEITLHSNTAPRLSASYRRSFSYPATPSIQFPGPPASPPPLCHPQINRVSPANCPEERLEETQPLTNMKTYSCSEDTLNDEECLDKSSATSNVQ